MICKKFLPSGENCVNCKDQSVNVFREVTGAYSENLCNTYVTLCSECIDTDIAFTSLFVHILEAQSPETQYIKIIFNS
jgi:hypothetical protein